MYEGIDNGELDVVTVYTVDPQLKEYDLKVLEDTKNFFPPYEASLVAANDVVDEHDKINDVLKSLVDTVSTKEMTDMIYEVDIEKREIKEVAKEFLQEKGMLD